MNRVKLAYGTKRCVVLSLRKLLRFCYGMLCTERAYGARRRAVRGEHVRPSTSSAIRYAPTYCMDIYAGHKQGVVVLNSSPRQYCRTLLPYCIATIRAFWQYSIVTVLSSAIR
eukprot:447587-Rhodomonas_salina.3